MEVALIAAGSLLYVAGAAYTYGVMLRWDVPGELVAIAWPAFWAGWFVYRGLRPFVRTMYRLGRGRNPKPTTEERLAEAFKSGALMAPPPGIRFVTAPSDGHNDEPQGYVEVHL